MDIQGLDSELPSPGAVGLPYRCRLGLRNIANTYRHTICIFLFLEMHRKTYRRIRGM